MNSPIARGAGLIALGCCTFTHAYAQDAGPADGAVGSNQPAEVVAEAGDSAAPARMVDILNYRVEGNTVLPRTEVELAVMDFMGPQRSVADIDAARASLEKAYRTNGFETVSVEIPEQDVRGGIIRLNVVETRIGRLRVTDARHVSPELVKQNVPALAEGKVPNYKDVSRELAALNKSPNKSVTPILRAGDAPGTVDVELNVDDSSPVHATFEVNDRSSSRTERLRATASVRYTNLFQADHSFSVQGQLAPANPSQSWVVSGSYVAPIHGTPLTLVAYGVHSDSDIAAVGGIGVIGSGDIFGVRGIYSFTTGRPTSPLVHSVTFGFDYKNFKESLTLIGSDSANTPIDYIPLILQYSLASRTEAQDIDLSLGLSFGPRGLAASDKEFALKRFGASANWAALRVDASYLRRLPGDWRAGLRLAVQYAGRPLISNEQFSIGGVDSVRGYNESQVLGDDGGYGQLQIDAPSLHKLFGTAVQEFRFFGFADAGIVRVHDALGDQPGNTKLYSAGGGVTVRAFKRLNLSALLAAPFINRGDAPTDFGNIRAHFRAWLDF